MNNHTFPKERLSALIKELNITLDTVEEVVVKRGKYSPGVFQPDNPNGKAILAGLREFRTNQALSIEGTFSPSGSGPSSDL